MRISYSGLHDKTTLWPKNGALCKTERSAPKNQLLLKHKTVTEH